MSEPNEGRAVPPWAPDVSAVALGQRDLFSDLDAHAYLNHAAVSPPSTEVLRAVRVCLEDYARRGLGAVPDWWSIRSRLRGSLGQLIGADPSRIAFVAGTSASVLAVAHCYPWTRGDRVICLRGEFPTNVTPWQRAAQTFGLELAWLDVQAFARDEGLDALDVELGRGAAMIAVSAVQFQTGLRMPLAAITERAHAAGARVFVDAIQACGVVPLDVMKLGVDFVGCGAHKWLMGTEGSGFLYVRDGVELVPRLASWLSHEDAMKFLFEGPGELRYDRPIRREPSFLEGGAQNGLGLVALEAGIAPMRALGVDAVYAHVQAYHDALEPGLLERGFESVRPRDPSRRSGILSLRPPAGVDLRELVSGLAERGVYCTNPDGHLRFSPHWSNALDEVPGVLDRIDEVLR